MDNVELQAACAALGYLDEAKYYKEPDCLETVKDLIRFLRRDNDSCATRRQLGEAEIVSKDLIPILKQYFDDRILFDTVVRLLANLTQPARLCFQGIVPEDKTDRNYYLEIEGHLQSYQQDFADDALFNVFASKLGDLLKLDWEHRQEEDRLLIERILIIIRNILHVPPNAAKERRTDDDASVHDQVLWAMHVSGMEDLLIYLACSENERRFAFHVLEIISLMFREQTAEQLATSGSTRALSEKQRDARELSNLLEREKLQKKANAKKFSSRHSAFGGTYVIANMKSISDHNIIYHQTPGSVKDLDLNRNKRNRKTPKNKVPPSDGQVTRRSTLIIRLYLKEFCVQFLENCYNSLMRVIKDLLVRSKAQDSDETYYLWALRFFMEFNRRVGFNVGLVSETLSVNTFHYIQVNLQTYFDSVLTQKKEAVMWSRRMHLALKAYHELISCVNEMDQSSDIAIRSSAKVIKSNVFYQMEYREIFLLLLKNFDESKQSRAYLRDLVEATHLFMKMVEQYCKSHSYLVVQRPKKGRSKKPNKKKSKNPVTVQLSEEERSAAWDDVSDEISRLLQGEGQMPDGIMPFDASSSADMDQQRVDAVYRVQEFLHQKSHGHAVALLRASREVWPGRMEFGVDGMPPEEELMTLRQICLVELPPRSNQPEEDDDVEEDDGEIEEEEHGPAQEVVEEQFSFLEFLNRFAQPQIVRAYVLLLSDFPHNSDHINHCATKMLHRLAYDLGLMAIIFQARLFQAFNRVFTDDVYRTARQYDELRMFAKHVLRKFFETLQSNDKVVVELFYWKSNKDAQHIMDGYSSMHNANKASGWTEEQIDELRVLFDEYNQLEKENTEGLDLVDHIMMRIIDRNKTRRQIIRQVTFLGFIGGPKELKQKSSVRMRSWTEEQEVELRHLFNQHRNSHDIVGDIMSKMSVVRPKKNLIEKILELGLVEDKKELWKKRMRKNKSGGSRQGRGGSGDLAESDVDSENDAPVTESESNGNTSDSSADNDNVRPPGQKPTPATRNKLPAQNKKPVLTKDKSVKPAANKNKPRKSVVKLKKIPNLVARVKTNGLDRAVMWLKTNLLRTVEDREEDDDFVSVPIVPIMEDHEDAMESSIFCELLRCSGLHPPSSEQERYWRIPTTLALADLRRIIAAFDSAPSGQDADSDEGSNKDTSRHASSDENDNHSDDSQKSNRSNMSDGNQQSSSSSRRDGINAGDRNSNNSDSKDEWAASKRIRNAALFALATKLKEGSNDEKRRERPARAQEETNEATVTVPQAKSRLKRFIDSDGSDLSDEDDNRLVIDDAVESSTRAAAVSDQELERTVAKKPRLVDSDDDKSNDDQMMTSPQRDDNQTPVKAVARKRVVVDSDSD